MILIKTIRDGKVVAEIQMRRYNLQKEGRVRKLRN